MINNESLYARSPRIAFSQYDGSVGLFDEGGVPLVRTPRGFAYKSLIGIFAFCCAVSAFGMSNYALNGTVLEITVPSGETNSIETAHIGAGTTDIRKLGRGGIVIDADLTDYTGDIHVVEGTWCVINSNGLGKLSKTALADDVGVVYVADGATLESKCSSAPMYFGKQIHVTGYGVNGLGALLVSGSVACNSSTWGSNLILEGDTYASSITTAIWCYNTGNNASYITFNGHDLVVCGGKGTNPFVVLSGCSNTDIGRLVVTNGTYLRFQNNVNFKAVNGQVGSIVVSNLGHLSGNQPYGRVEWDVVWDTQRSFIPGTYTSADVPVTNKCSLHGAVELKQKMNVTVSNGGGTGFFGPISGNYGMSIYHDSTTTKPTNRVYFANANNTFTGGILADTILLDVPVDGAIPQAAQGTSLLLEDSSVAFSDVMYALPDAVITNNQECTITEGRGKWASFAKAGTGTLFWQSRIGVDVLEVANGTFKFMLPDSSLRERAGLVEGVDYYTVSTDASSAAGASTVATPYAIQSGTRAMYSNHQIDIRRPEGYKENPNQWYNISYSGYIWNRSETNRNVTFASKMATTARINIDGTLVLAQGSGKSVILATVTLTPGPHWMVVNNYAKVNDGGITWGATNMAWEAKGMMFDPEGRNSRNAEYYIRMDDPGDGSIFTWSLPEEDVTNPVDSTKLAKGLPDFKTLRFVGTAGVFDSSDYALTVENVEGIPVVQNGGDAFTVEKTWILNVADVLAGRKATGLPLAFGTNAELVLKNYNAIRGTNAWSGEKWLIAESTQSITGCLTITDVKLARNWSVSIEGNKIYLNYAPSGMVFIMR